ncbi:hypothetical protein LXL04_026195 [Taraxacum kok-saghyz]
MYDDPASSASPAATSSPCEEHPPTPVTIACCSCACNAAATASCALAFACQTCASAVICDARASSSTLRRMAFSATASLSLIIRDAESFAAPISAGYETRGLRRKGVLLMVVIESQSETSRYINVSRMINLGNIHELITTRLLLMDIRHIMIHNVFSSSFSLIRNIIPNCENT